MKISELISQLQSIQEKHGDLPVYKFHEDLQFEVRRVGKCNAIEYPTIIGYKHYPDRVILIDGSELENNFILSTLNDSLSPILTNP